MTASGGNECKRHGHATGRATAWLLEFNSDERFKLRQDLRLLGLL